MANVSAPINPRCSRTDFIQLAKKKNGAEQAQGLAIQLFEPKFGLAKRNATENFKNFFTAYSPRNCLYKKLSVQALNKLDAHSGPKCSPGA
jgi:hypothetical protein